MRDDSSRPDPEALLELARREAGPPGRGRLRVFLGMAPGVGKTYSMLEAAQLRRREGLDVLVGVVETHGRQETEALLWNLPVQPRNRLEYKGHLLEEFDLDAALARRPALVLVDELAHSNAPGSRHPKRYQDVEELLDQGLDVWTTLNVQHVESLNDVVAQITGVRVAETVPDAVLERAEAVILVDLPPEDLRERLAEGKVYLPEQARWATENFFKAGNLNALRELALRCTANRVNAEVLVYRQGHAIATTWPTAERILVCVGPSPSSATLVRSAKRQADGLHAPWMALYVQARAEGGDQARAQANLRLAQELGAETHVLPGGDVARQIVAFARQHNVTRILIGKPLSLRWRDLWRGSPVDQLIRLSGEIDVSVIKAQAPSGPPPPAPPRAPVPWRDHGLALAVVAACTVLGFAMHPFFDLANLIMVYLLGVMAVSVWLHRDAAVTASVLSVLAFDFCFVPPRFLFTVADVSYLFTFAVMFAAALVVSTLAGRIRDQADAAGVLERQATALSALSRDLAATRGAQDLLRVAQRHLQEVFACSATAYLADAAGRLTLTLTDSGRGPLSERDLAVAQWVLANGRPAGLGTDTLPETPAMYLPLAGAVAPLGVVGIHPTSKDSRQRLLRPDQVRLLESFVRQAALALEVDLLEDTAQANLVAAEQEKLRAALLSTVTHDFRSPLTAIAGSAEGLLALDETADPALRRTLAGNISAEAQRLGRLVDNLLRLAALESGRMAPAKEPTCMDDVAGAALARLGKELASHAVQLDLPPDLPPVPADPVLLEQVFLNLLENAAKYAPPGGAIRIAARPGGSGMEVRVDDDGPGLPPGDPQRLFERFERGDRAGGSGYGLGLAICRAIVKAHGGSISGRTRPEGGASFTFTLPWK